VPLDDMLRTFNMGIGLIIVTSASKADHVLVELAARGGRDARVIGEIVAGQGPVVAYTGSPLPA
jgi:phosphoribosylaminoimidazole (AIR) synthetase